MRSNRLHILIASVLVVVVTYPLYLVLSAIYALPTPASAEAQPIDQLFDAHFLLIAFLFALVMVFMLYAAFVFRRREGDEGDGEHFHGNMALEVAWTVAPLGLVVIFSIWGTQMLTDITSPKENEMTIRVIGRQWSWSFEYEFDAPEGYDRAPAFVSPDLYLPVDQPVKLEMVTQDVLHSFWVPEFRVKQDLVPRTVPTYLRFTPSELGEYKVRCAEICGLQHHSMRADVQVVNSGDYQTWFDERVTATVNAPPIDELTPVERGEYIYNDAIYNCVSCHSIDGTTENKAGPSWLGLLGSERVFEDGTTAVADAEYIRNSILNPYDQIVEGYAEVMPLGFDAQFDELEAVYGNQFDLVDDITAYIDSLDDE